MAITFFVNGETKAVTTVQPDMTSKGLIEVFIPEGLPIKFLLQQLQSLSNSLSASDAQQQAALLVIKVVYGSS
jgi:hypothetical protein